MADQHRPPVTGYPAPPASNGYPTTQYPYGAQPNQSHGSYLNVAGPYHSDPQQRSTFIRRIFAFIIACVIITGTIVFIMWLILRPQLPKCRLDTLTLSNYNMSSRNQISGNWEAQLTMRNPNSKIQLYFDHIEAAVFYKSESISATTVPPFSQGKKTETGVNATFVSSSRYVDDGNGISSDVARGRVDFNLMMVARVRFRAGGWWARWRIIRVRCPSLSVSVRVSGNSTGGSLVGGGSRHCRVSS